MVPCSGWGVRSQEQIHAALPESSWGSCGVGRATEDVVGVTFLKEASNSCFCLSCNIVPTHYHLWVFKEPRRWYHAAPQSGDLLWFLSALKMAPTLYSFPRLNDLPHNYLDTKPIRQVLGKVTAPSASVPPYLMIPVNIPKILVTNSMDPIQCLSNSSYTINTCSFNQHLSNAYNGPSVCSLKMQWWAKWPSCGSCLLGTCRLMNVEQKNKVMQKIHKGSMAIARVEVIQESVKCYFIQMFFHSVINLFSTCLSNTFIVPCLVNEHKRHKWGKLWSWLRFLLTVRR